MKTNTINIVEILSKLGIEELNRMQKESLEAHKKEKDIILLSPTGSGKTLAYLLPLLQQLTNDPVIQSLILVPSRELALQIETVFKSMDTGFKICCCYGGHSASEEKKVLLQNPAVVVGTPGRITDHLLRGNINPETIRFLILDEFDKSLEFGFHDEMADIIGRLSNLYRRVLLSATDAEEIPDFTGLSDTIKLNYLPSGQDVENRLKLMKVISPDKDKVETLYELLCHLGETSTIVFCNYREAVDRVGNYLKSQKLYSEVFHGGMEQEQRERAIYKFRNGSCNVLISTDLASRGLDIPEIENIIHYHLPVNEEAYVHRNGRTARWDATGNAYLLLHAEENIPEYINLEPDTFTLPGVTPKPSLPVWTTLYIGKGKKDKLSKGDIVGFLFKKGNLNKEDVGVIDVREHYSFVSVKRKKVNQLLTLVSGEKIKGMRTKIEKAD